MQFCSSVVLQFCGHHADPAEACSRCPHEDFNTESQRYTQRNTENLLFILILTLKPYKSNAMRFHLDLPIYKQLWLIVL